MPERKDSPGGQARDTEYIDSLAGKKIINAVGEGEVFEPVFLTATKGIDNSGQEDQEDPEDEETNEERQITQQAIQTLQKLPVDSLIQQAELVGQLRSAMANITGLTGEMTNLVSAAIRRCDAVSQQIPGKTSISDVPYGEKVNQTITEHHQGRTLFTHDIREMLNQLLPMLQGVEQSYAQFNQGHEQSRQDIQEVQGHLRQVEGIFLKHEQTISGFLQNIEQAQAIIPEELENLKTAFISYVEMTRLVLQENKIQEVEIKKLQAESARQRQVIEACIPLIGLIEKISSDQPVSGQEGKSSLPMTKADLDADPEIDERGLLNALTRGALQGCDSLKTIKDRLDKSVQREAAQAANIEKLIAMIAKQRNGQPLSPDDERLLQTLTSSAPGATVHPERSISDNDLIRLTRDSQRLFPLPPTNLNPYPSLPVTPVDGFKAYIPPSSVLADGQRHSSPPPPLRDDQPTDSFFTFDPSEYEDSETDSLAERMKTMLRRDHGARRSSVTPAPPSSDRIPAVHTFSSPPSSSTLSSMPDIPLEPIQDPGELELPTEDEPMRPKK